MSEGEPNPDLDAEQPPENEVVVSSLLHPPTREFPDRGMVYLITARATPGNTEPDWEAKHYSDSREYINYVPMNSCAVAEFDRTGYLGTGNLNGCTVVAATYRDTETDTVHVFMGHYDAEGVRKTDDSGTLKISTLLTEFAGTHRLRVAVAYSKDHNPLPTGNIQDAEDYPVWTILNNCQKLADKSDVVTIPYATSRDVSDPTIGHTFAVGRGGADLIHFDWDGHTIEVGQPDEFGAARRQAARAAIEDIERDQEDWLLE